MFQWLTQLFRYRPNRVFCNHCGREKEYKDTKKGIGGARLCWDSMECIETRQNMSKDMEQAHAKMQNEVLASPLRAGFIANDHQDAQHKIAMMCFHTGKILVGESVVREDGKVDVTVKEVK